MYNSSAISTSSSRFHSFSFIFFHFHRLNIFKCSLPDTTQIDQSMRRSDRDSPSRLDDSNESRKVRKIVDCDIHVFVFSYPDVLVLSFFVWRRSPRRREFDNSMETCTEMMRRKSEIMTSFSVWISMDLFGLSTTWNCCYKYRHPRKSMWAAIRSPAERGACETFTHSRRSYERSKIA